jgi:ribonuclease HI
MSVTIATDGSCIGNPGPGAFAVLAQLTRNGETNTFECAVPFPATTVGEMEVRGLLEALLLIIRNAMWTYGPITIKCDAQYVVNGFNDWMANWEAKGWHKKGGLAHAALWKEIATAKAAIAAAGATLRVEWVKAHQTGGCPLNARVDELANSSARSQTGRNLPALQECALGVSDRLRDAGALAQPSLTSAPARPAAPTLEEALKLLAEARDMVDHFRGPADTGAEQLSVQIGALLERAEA